MYLEKHIWSKREHWATCYFPHKFTLGHSTTQRSESWNSTLKCFKDSSTLVDLIHGIKIVYKRQKEAELKLKLNPMEIFTCANGTDSEISTKLTKIVIDNCISKYVCEELHRSLQATISLKFKNVNYFKANETGTKIELNADIEKLFHTSKSPGMYTNTKISIDLDSLISKTPESSNNITMKDRVQIKCECIYPKRMKIPCKHVLAFCLHIDKNPGLLHDSIKLKDRKIDHDFLHNIC